MKRIAVLVWLLVPVARAHALPSVPETPVVDFSQDFRPGVGGDFLSDEEQTRLFSILYPEDNASDENCIERLNGDMHSAYGFFTQRDRKEVLVAFTSWRCGVHAGQHGNVAIVRDGRVILWNDTVEASEIEVIADVDGDGLSEVVLSYTDGGQGQMHTEATTLSFKNQGIQVLNYISGTVHIANCTRDDGKEYAAVFYQRPDGVTVQQQNFVKRCDGERNAYRFYSAGPLEPRD